MGVVASDPLNISTVSWRSGICDYYPVGGVAFFAHSAQANL